MDGVARRRAAEKVIGGITPSPSEKMSVVPAASGTQDSRTAPAPGSSPGQVLASRLPGDDERQALHEPTPGLDRRSALRLKRGQMAIEARIDLHGMIQAEAHRALAALPSPPDAVLHGQGRLSQ